ncbi:uncharacterized protein LOC143202534 [Rhynchophorus ferrugineus]|uniref:RING-type domain-containing protein n=1 Tax=Rhynchophorus ferrugineus TaxID=354439 RepID=A0A834MFB7_RHYFE|nr:hypothetical protein GWI33_004733 [Rhynchophorus ferrugineus]
MGSTYPINTLVSHFKEKHKNHMSSNEYQLDCIALGAHLRLILHKGLPYLLFFYENKINIWISVYSVNTEDNDVMFQIQFQSVDTNKSLVFQANVTPFDDQEHCLNCLHHICSNNYHKYSKVGSNYDIINKSMEFSVEKSYLSSLLSCKHVYYTVNIMEETEDSLQKSLIRNLECPVCKMPMSAPIFRCRKGHAICNICSKKLTKCPLCKSQLTNSRCFALEGIAQDIELCCSNKKNGCTFTGNVNQCIAHENYCSVKPIHNLKM